MGLKTRLQKIEKTVNQAERVLLIDWGEVNPKASGLDYEGRIFPDVKAAVEALEAERGRKVEPVVMHLFYEEAPPSGIWN